MNSRTLKLFLVATTGAAALAAWWLPGPKKGAIAQRLDYPQFLIALVVTVTAVSVTASALITGPQRQASLFRIAALWLGIGLALAAWEIGAWTWPAKHLMDNPWYTAVGGGIEASEHLPHQRRPNLSWTGLSRGDLAMLDDSPDPDARVVTYATDSQGFRNADEADRAEIVFLGDSFTEAGYLPLKETFVILAGKRTNCTVRNLGVAGYSAPTELIVLNRFGLDFSPRTVVWQIAESNDLDDALRYDQWLRAGKPDYRQDPKASPTRYDRWRNRSPTHRLFDLLRSRDAWPLAGTFRDVSGAVREVRFLPNLPNERHSPARHVGWPLTAAAIRTGADSLRASGIDLVVVLIPMKLRALANAIDFHAIPAGAGPRRPGSPLTLPTDWDLEPQATLAHYLRKLCDELGARFVDPASVFKQQAANGELIYMAMDTHLSPAGHRIVADLIVDQLDPTRCGSYTAP